MHISEPHLKADLTQCMHVVRSYTIFITEANYIVDVFRTLVITVRSKEKASAGSIWNEYMKRRQQWLLGQVDFFS